jgi:hypothetical protein
MPKRREFTRKSGLRDSRLIIIASEGEITEKAYFEGMKEYFTNPRIHIEILHRMESASDPARVIRLLDQFRSEYKLRRGYDQLWLVIDVDRWRSRKLSFISQQCNQKQYQLAISNPAFEIWLLLHIRSLNDYPFAVQAELLQNRKKGNRTRLEQELLKLLGSYNKVNPDMQFFCQLVSTAIRNARSADTQPENRWPNGLGTRVYLLVEEIVPKRDAE